MNNLLRHNYENKEFLSFDFETEGLSLFNSRGWDIAWSIYKGKNLVEKHQYFIKWPNLNVSAGAAAVTGFNQKTIDEFGRDPKEICDLFDSYIYNPKYICIGANAIHYDLFIHNTHRREFGLKSDYSYLNRMIDTNAISKAYKLNRKPPTDKDDFIPFQYSMLNFRQKGLKTSNAVMAKELEIKVDDTKFHGALYDAEITFQVFLQLMQKVELVDYYQ